MTNLAIECSGTAGSVGLFDEENPISYSDLDTSFSSVRTLASEIERIMRGQTRPKLISVTNGPGSFTGLRVGLTTAKMLAMAWNIPVMPVDTLHAIALRAHGAIPHLSPEYQPEAPILAVINAFRGQVFATAVQFKPKLTVIMPSCVLNSEHWQARPLAGVTAMGKPTSAFVSGPGLKNYPLSGEVLDGVLYQILPPEVWNPTATEVARLGRIGFEAGLACNAFTLEPSYLRVSAAEEKANSKG
ncbi:MAG: tRNA (adenosine(37)-N6)-threonylcarbamoyltransferase complex dimerization subunit type 1 TsaB [Pirellulaceae bacterium]|nr:tRNA (adenosine(37)-N6)-threonylcarbamoyltransferase complex dimerization subunit type 1 TsaB [Pirellulaceae bacterium]